MTIVRCGAPFRAHLVAWVLFALALLPLCLLFSADESGATARFTGGWAAADGARPSGPRRGSALVRAWNDNPGGSLPEVSRLENGQDRQNFVLWFTFLAEASFYAPTRQAQVEVKDCAGLIRYAHRNALLPHTPAWRQSSGLPFDPGFGDVSKWPSSRRPMERALFRTGPGPLLPGDPGRGAFSEFADAATLLEYNTFLISRDIRAARPGDLIFFHQSVQREPFHTMLFVGKSHFQPAGRDWIVYHTGDLGGQSGEVREVQAGQLLGHPQPRWRPLAVNPNFLGVYRLEILR